MKRPLPTTAALTVVAILVSVLLLLAALAVAPEPAYL